MDRLITACLFVLTLFSFLLAAKVAAPECMECCSKAQRQRALEYRVKRQLIADQIEQDFGDASTMLGIQNVVQQATPAAADGSLNNDRTFEPLNQQSMGSPDKKKRGGKAPPSAVDEDNKI